MTPRPPEVGLTDRVVRVRTDALPLVQAALAAGIAWFLAHDVIGHRAPIFAPIGALLVLSNAPGRRVDRVLAATIGAVVGIAVGDLLVAALGTGAIQVALVALLAMSAAALLGGSPTLVTNAGVAGVLIATIQPPHGLYSTAAVGRLVDVMVGGGVSLCIAVALPVHTLASTRAAAIVLFADLAGTLDDAAFALDSRDIGAAEETLERARTLDALVGRLREEAELAYETARLAPLRWRKRHVLARYGAAATNLELAVRNVRVLARAVLRAVELTAATPAELSLSVRELAAAVRGLRIEIEGGEDEGAAGRQIVRAAGRANEVAESGAAALPIAALVAQVRSTATDLLQACGLNRSEAVDRVRSSSAADLER
ncbi:MAG TPA: FUSC family protein [Solirubrobacteraceae bacterium]|nr:FUSC family protein [Solirubrobacteraceae bacterium]